MNEEPSLIDLALDGKLTPSELCDFQNRLKKDADLRQQYYEMVATHYLLEEQYGRNARIEDAIRRSRAKWISRNGNPRTMALSVAATFILLASILTGLYSLNYRSRPVGITTTADSRVLVDGSSPKSMILEPGKELSILRGSASIRLNPRTTAILGAPARLRLRDRQGNIDLLSGAAYFDVRSDGSGHGIDVHAAGRIVRDIGTEFGLIVASASEGEAHVFSGKISVSNAAGGASRTFLTKNNAVGWSDETDATGIATDSEKFLTSMPKSTPLLADDFSEPDGTRIDGKSPDIGSAWKVHWPFGDVPAPTFVSRGRYDSSHGTRELSAAFRYAPPLTGKSSVYVADFRLLVPSNDWTADEEPDGIAKIIFHGFDGSPIFALSAAIADGNRWRISDEITGSRSPLLSDSSERKSAIRLIYDSRGGRATLEPLSAPYSESTVSLALAPDLHLHSVTLVNIEGGDIALDSLKIQKVDYPKIISHSD